MPRRVLEGKVVSNKAAKTVAVLVERKIRDPLYGKIMRRSREIRRSRREQPVANRRPGVDRGMPPALEEQKWKVIGGKAMGESQARTVDEAEAKRASVKRDLRGAGCG